jgi:hypothetical protein
VAGTNPNDPFGVQPGTALPNDVEVDTLVSGAAELSASLAVFLDTLDGDARAKRDDFLEKTRAQFKGLQETIPGLGKVGPTNEQIKSVLLAAEKQAEKEASAYRREVCKANEARTNDTMKRLHDATERLGAFVRIYPSPQALLSVQHLSDPKRATYHANLQHAGPVELTTLARLAIQTGDRALAAAVLAKNDQTPRESRQFSSADFASRMVGKEHERYVTAHKQVASLFQSTRNRLWAMQTGKPVPLAEKVKQGLRDSELARRGVKKPTDGDAEADAA